MRASRILASTVLAIGFLGFASANAADPKGWVGALGGISVPNQNDASARPMVGITGGAKVGSEFGVGGYYLTASKDEGGTVGTISYDLFGVELAYHFEGEANGVYLGGRLGTGKAKAGAASASPLNYGAVAGYNGFLNDHLSLGGEVNFFSLPETGDVDGFTMLNFLGSVKFWF